MIRQAETQVVPISPYPSGSIPPVSFQGTGNIAVSDSAQFSPNISTWTPGNTIIVTPTINPGINQKWSLLSIGFVAYLTTRGQGSAFGKLGDIIGGLPDPSRAVATNTTSATFTGLISESANGVMLPLPNPNLSVPIWTPGDPLPPAYNSAVAVSPTLPVSTSLQFPNPIELYDGYPLAVGVWIKPSLVGSPGSGFYEMDVTNLSFTLTYDDDL